MNFAEAVNEMLAGKKVCLPPDEWTNYEKKAYLTIHNNLIFLFDHRYIVKGKGHPADCRTGACKNNFVKSNNWRLFVDSFKDVEINVSFKVSGRSEVFKKTQVVGTTQFYAVDQSGKLFQFADEQEVTKL